MERRQLKYLLTVARVGSFSRAAVELHMTQPPLSSAIASLEQSLGIRLLERSSRGVTPTLGGREVLRFAERMVEQESELRRRLEAIGSGKLGTIEVGANPILTGRLIPKVLRELTNDPYNLDIALHESHPNELIDAVENGRLDIAVVATASNADLRMLHSEFLHVEPLAVQEMVAVLPPEMHDLPDPLPLRLIADQVFAVPRTSMRDGVRIALLDAFERAGLHPPRIREVPSMQEAIPLVSSGLSVAIMPEAISELVHPDRAIFRRLENGPGPFEVSVITRTDRAHLPHLMRFRETAIRQAQEVAPESRLPD